MSSKAEYEKRIERAVQQPIRLLNLSLDEAQKQAALTVIGSTGSIYKVEWVEEHIKFLCSCPDFTRRKLWCKHIYFVVWKVLKQTENQMKTGTCLTTEKIWQTFMSCAQYEQQNNDLQKQDISGTVTQKPIMAESECCICFCLLSEGLITYCKYSCGQSVHKACVETWQALSMQRFNSKPVCPLCRAPYNHPR